MIGFVNVNKPAGLSSSKVVTIVKKIFNTSKVGHMGTLDPLAQGVLPIAIGKATRMFDYFLEKRKTYIAEFTFGSTTDTLDSEGQITETTNVIPSKSQIEEILSRLTGKIDQIPPQFSAKKVNGRCAYDLARKGEKVELKSKQIEIYYIKLLSCEENIFTFEIECSGGTYIRSIARDMADLVNSKAYMSKLTRIKSGKFDISNSLTLEELRDVEKTKTLISIEDIFDFDICNLSESQTKDLLDGKNLEVAEFDGQYFIKCGTILIGVGDVNNHILKLKTYLKEDL